MNYHVKTTYTYTTEIWVEANSENEAMRIAYGNEDAESNNDILWLDSEIIGRTEEPSPSK